MIALDVAASEMFKDNRYVAGITFTIMKGTFSSTRIILLYEFIKKFPIYSIEDGLMKMIGKAGKNLTLSIGDKVQLVGDDLICYSKKIIKKRNKIIVGKFYTL